VEDSERPEPIARAASMISARTNVRPVADQGTIRDAAYDRGRTTGSLFDVVDEYRREDRPR
jgi:hypothetical protein